MNQAIYSKIYVEEETENLTSEFAEPFDLLLSNEVTSAAEDHVVYLRENPRYVEQQIADLYREWSADEQRKLSTVSEKLETPPLMRRV